MSKAQQSQSILMAQAYESSGITAYYINASNGTYIMKNSREDWIVVNEKGLIRKLKTLGFSDRAAKGSPASDTDLILNHIQENHSVDWWGTLAGRRKGLAYDNGNSLLITKEADLIQPQEGDWNIIEQILRSMLIGEDPNNDIQYRSLIGWLSIAVKSLYFGEPRTGHVVVLAGCGNSMKSFTSNFILAPIFGGRIGNPKDYMAGLTQFNDDLLSSEFLLIDDEVYDPKISARRKFGSGIKLITANRGIKCAKKFYTSVHLTPFWRMVICINDEPENLAVLPPLDKSLEDKMLVFKVHPCEAPMNTNNEEERELFRNQIASELPAFVNMLIEYEIPEDIAAPRFGVKHYQHPEVIEALQGLQPEFKLKKYIEHGFRLMDRNVNYLTIPRGDRDQIAITDEYVEARADLIEQYVRGNLTPSQQTEMSAICYYSTAFAVFLERLSRIYPEAFEKLPGRQGWRIYKSELYNHS